jgi:CubicO group peptidase (beta-lactamase class C family)
MEALKKWDKGLLFKPGDNYRYSNPGYSILALLVEKLSKTSFADYLRRNIFLSAQMNQTYLLIPDKTTVYHNPDTALVKLNVQSTWYEKDYAAIDSAGQYRYFIYNCAGTYGEKNIISTIGDLLKFDAALFGGRLLMESTLQEAFTPIRLNNGKIWYADHMDTMEGEGKQCYGLGFELFEQPLFGKSVGHGGFMGGLATFYMHNLKTNQTIIAYQNTSGREFGNIVTAAFYLMNHHTPFQIKLQESLARIYGSTMKEKGIDDATVVLNELRSDTSNYYLSEQEMNWLGGDLLYMGKFKNHKEYGLEVLKVNTFLFPASFNVYDSYADALLQNGKKEDAIKMYKKSLMLNPNNEGGKDALKHLSENK